MSSLANDLEHRVITIRYISFSRKNGRMRFREFYDNDENRNPIGREMVYGATGYRSRNDGTWLFRAYQDGTAIYKKNKTESIINRRNCHEPIWKTILEYYNVDTEIDGENWHDKIIFLRRKPLSEYAKNLALNETNLGDYLVRKYNIRGENVAV